MRAAGGIHIGHPIHGLQGWKGGLLSGASARPGSGIAPRPPRRVAHPPGQRGCGVRFLRAQSFPGLPRPPRPLAPGLASAALSGLRPRTRAAAGPSPTMRREAAS